MHNGEEEEVVTSSGLASLQMASDIPSAETFSIELSKNKMMGVNGISKLHNMSIFKQRRKIFAKDGILFHL